MARIYPNPEIFDLVYGATRTFARRIGWRPKPHVFDRLLHVVHVEVFQAMGSGATADEIRSLATHLLEFLNEHDLLSAPQNRIWIHQAMGMWCERLYQGRR